MARLNNQLFQQQPFFFSPPPLTAGSTGLVKTIVSFCVLCISYFEAEGISPLLLDVGSFTYGRRAAIYLKNYWMLLPVLALTYLKRTRFF